MESNPVFEALDMLLEQARKKADRQDDVNRFDRIRVELKAYYSNNVPEPKPKPEPEPEPLEVEENKQPDLFTSLPPVEPKKG